MKKSQFESLILWRQVGGVAVLQGAITLTWMLYQLYVPQLLAGFGFPGFDKAIAILEDALAVAIEPLAGWLSDKQRQWMGTRFPIIVVGAILSSVLFIMIPAIFLLANPASFWRLILPVVIVAWAVAMAMFRSPAVSLLGKYATPKELPQAMSLLVLVGGLIRAIKPVSSDFILGLGPAFTFAIGSFALLAAVAFLRSVNPDATVSELPSDTGIDDRISILSLALIAVTGMAVAWGSRAMAERILPDVLATQIPGIDIKLLMMGVGFALAFASLPAAAVAVRAGNQRALLGGLATTAVLLLVMAFSQGALAMSAIVMAVIFSYSLVANGTVPFALSLVPPLRGGLGVGIYFGGFSLGMTLYSVVFGEPGAVAVVKVAFIGTIAFLVAAACVAVGDRMKPTLPVTN
ncbi:MAG: SLC45 family MFS transporter [Microcoleus sp. CSU_2_2]|nr:SLC45 family MFS transporter [Microcoleus sp. SU_5_3]NJS11755.1 SLC45 family MFS transporter [Microcoleus sp. CSU_2_2]